MSRIQAFLRFSAVKAVRRTVSVSFLAACCAIAALPMAASGQTAFTLPAPPFELPFLPPLSGSWTVTIGAQGQYQPDFEGAKASMLSAAPIFSIHRAGSADPFRSPLDSASIALIDFGDLRAGPAAKFVPARLQDGHPELFGLGDVNAALELGGFIEYFPVDWFRLRNETRAGLGGHRGVVSDFSADFIVPMTSGITISGGPRFAWESTDAISPYFSINAAQAMATGLPIFNAMGGAHSAGAGMQVKYQISPQWEVHSFVEYERLLGDAANSPLVAVRGSVNQTTVGIGASYSFDVKIR